VSFSTLATHHTHCHASLSQIVKMARPAIIKLALLSLVAAWTARAAQPVSTSVLLLFVVERVVVRPYF
jgi:hypothetical protein